MKIINIRNTIVNTVHVFLFKNTVVQNLVKLYYHL